MRKEQHVPERGPETIAAHSKEREREREREREKSKSLVFQPDNQLKNSTDLEKVTVPTESFGLSIYAFMPIDYPQPSPGFSEVGAAPFSAYLLVHFTLFTFPCFLLH